MSVDTHLIAHLHGGPYNGETMPIARCWLAIPMPVWGDGFDDSTTALYRVRGPWLGQPDAHYDYVLPDPPDPGTPPALRLWRRLFHGRSR